MWAGGERADMRITRGLEIPEDELEWIFSRAGGPGGQNVNKVASKAQLRWHVEASSCLPPMVRQRLCEQQRNRITLDGWLVITAQEHRDQERNRQECQARLDAMVEQAWLPPKPRRPTRPSRGAREARLGEKRHRSDIKSQRRKGADD